MTSIDLRAELAEPVTFQPVAALSQPEVLDLADLHQVVGGDIEVGELPKNGW